MWYVYLLECADTSFYCGISSHVEQRLASHNGERPGGAKYTRGRRPVRLLGAAACADKGAALRLEQEVKALPRHKKLAFLLAQPEILKA